MSDAPYEVLRPDQFIRRGQIGDGLEALNEEQLAAYRERFDRTLAEFPMMASYR